MTAKTKALLLSAFVCPGIGQLKLGKKRGWIFILIIMALIIWLLINIMIITMNEMQPDLMMRLDPIEYGGAFFRIQYRVYHENAVAIFGVVATWLGSLIDLLMIKSDHA